ncbi:MAG: creatininase family protein [Alphaproteobacteria bacterium]
MAVRRWADLTTVEAGALGSDAVAVLPAGAIEQHGPHLPLSVDGDIAAGILTGASTRLPVELPVYALPALTVGVSVEHADFPGTLSLSAETFIRTVVEMGGGVAYSGVRRLVLLNGHGGQPQALDLAAQELRHRHRMLVAVVNTFDLYDSSSFGEDEVKYGIHAGAVETSIMLALHPDAVRHAALADFESLTRTLKADFALASPQGKFGFAWQAQDLNPAGAVGNAKAADQVRGRALVDEASARLAQFLVEFSHLPLEILKSRGTT